MKSIIVLLLMITGFLYGQDYELEKINIKVIKDDSGRDSFYTEQESWENFDTDIDRMRLNNYIMQTEHERNMTDMENAKKDRKLEKKLQQLEREIEQLKEKLK